MSDVIYKIICEEALEKLICSKCNNYLSYGTVKVGNNVVICERCDQTSTTLQLFNENIRKYLFPCVNRFNDCNSLLSYNEVRHHEILCKKRKEASCAECEFKGNGNQIYYHYVKNHPDNILRCPSFQMRLLVCETKTYLHRKNNILSFVKYQILQDNWLHVSVKRYGNFQAPPSRLNLTMSTIEFSYDFENEIERKVNFASICKEKIVVGTLHVGSSPHLFTLNMQTLIKPVSTLTHQKLKMKEKQYKNLLTALTENLFPKLLCSGCARCVIPPIIRCPKNHVICEHCKHSFCTTCNDIVNWTPAPDLEAFHAIIPLPCRWNCDTMVLSNDLRRHEKSCPERKYKCLNGCEWRGDLDALVDHWHGGIPVYYDSHQFSGDVEGLVEYYLIHDQEIFYCRMDRMTELGRNCHVRTVSDGAFRNYSASLRFMHQCDNVSRNLLRHLKIGGITLIQKHDFFSFGPCKNYKMTFIVLTEL